MSRKSRKLATAQGVQSHVPQEEMDLPRRTFGGMSRWFWPAVAILIVLVGVAYYQLWAGPKVYYEQAKAILGKRPVQADRLAQLAIDKAGGDYPAAQLLQCRALAATNQWDAALGGFMLIKSTASCETADLMALGETALKSHRYQLAETALEAARMSENPPTRVYELLVPLNAQFGRGAQVLGLCRLWQKANPDEPRAWAFAANVEASQMDFGPAISDFREALLRQPDPELELLVRKSLVQLLADTGDFSGARKELDIVKKSGELDQVLKLKSVQILRMEGQLKLALEEIESFLKHVEKSPEALKQRGILQLDMGDNAAAIRDLTAALAENDFDKDAHFKLAQAYIRTGKKPLAEPHLARHRRLTEATTQILDVTAKLERDPTNEKLKKQLDELYQAIGRKSAATR